MIKDKNLFLNYKKYIFYCIIIKVGFILLTKNNILYEITSSYIIYSIGVGAITGSVFTVWYNKFKSRKLIGNIIFSYIISSLITQILLIILYTIFIIIIYVLIQ